jgi:hypothetical protein
MGSLGRVRQVLGRTGEYASADEFCRIFQQEMSGLYGLALVLTGDEGKAEKCFVAGLEECIAGNAVFREWARSWSKRVVIRHAIRLIAPAPGSHGGPPKVEFQANPSSRATTALEALALMQPFDRFVFVMAVLEKYSDRDCAALLGCARADVVEAKIRAFRQVARAREEASACLESKATSLGAYVDNGDAA